MTRALATNGHSADQVEPTIERATPPTCADGDNCPRYHCRADRGGCGAYWLGNDLHICGVEVNMYGSASPREQLQKRVCTWMAEALADGGDPVTCTRRVVDQVRAAGLAEALLEWAIGELWSDHQRLDDDGGRAAESPAARQRPSKVHQVAQAPAARQAGAAALAEGEALGERSGEREASPELAVDEQVDTLAEQSRPGYADADNGVFVGPERWPAAPGPRRADVELLATDAALLESLHQVSPGQWVRLGDLNRRQCQVLERKYAAAAEKARLQAVVFARLADELEAGQTVRQRWSAEQIAGLIGDTLVGPAPAPPAVA